MDITHTAAKDVVMMMNVLTLMTTMVKLIMLLMMMLTMIPMMILMMILMMMLMMVGAGACILARLKDQGPCPGKNEHPRRAMDVI